MPHIPIIAVDFDGTCVDHRYPAVGEDVPGAVDWLRHLARCGVRLILWTMRSDDRADGTAPLADAVAWFAAREIPLFGINVNPDQRWSTSPKAYANAYIDDAAIGCPLRAGPRAGSRPMVDWAAVGPAVVAAFHLEAADDPASGPTPDRGEP